MGYLTGMHLPYKDRSNDTAHAGGLCAYSDTLLGCCGLVKYVSYEFKRSLINFSLLTPNSSLLTLN
jgi:hypothetical protein